jgi:hypothetical protein
MGLDMYLYGNKCSFSKEQKVDGFPVSSVLLEMGYWNKRVNLHGFIVEAFAAGFDDGQKIDLDKDDLDYIINVWENDSHYDELVTGFFFGKAYFTEEKDEYDPHEEQKARDIELFTKAKNWLTEEHSKDEYRSIYYEASWL